MPADFLDSNVLLYLTSGDKVKADRAEALLENSPVISVQVLNELTSVVRRKLRFSWDETRTFLHLVRGFTTVEPVTLQTHETGLWLAERYGFSPYDAMIAASALLAGCNTLWSEDLQHGQVIAGKLRVANPFRA